MNWRRVHNSVTLDANRRQHQSLLNLAFARDYRPAVARAGISQRPVGDDQPGRSELNYDWLKRSLAHLHCWYDKAVRPGRKVGHLNLTRQRYVTS